MPDLVGQDTTSDALDSCGFNSAAERNGHFEALRNLGCWIGRSSPKTSTASMIRIQNFPVSNWRQS